jgi:hypothetical protein
MDWKLWMRGCVVALAFTGCEADDDVDDELRAADDDAIDEDCPIVWHGFHGWSIAEGVHSVTLVPTSPMACGDAVELELTVVVGDEPVPHEVDATDVEPELEPDSLPSYWLVFGGVPLFLGNGPLTWSYRFTLSPAQSWATLATVAETGGAEDRLLAGTWFAFARPLAGGGQYRGPGDVVPSWVRPYGGGSGPTTPNWQIPIGASRRTVCSGRAPSICVGGIFWDAAAAIAQTQGFCAAAHSEHGQMASYASSRMWPGYPAPSCRPTTGLVFDMWGTTRQRCSNPPARLACASLSPVLPQAEYLDLITDVISTNNLWEGCRQELDANLGC